MSRKTKRFLATARQLNAALDKDIDLFFEHRKYTELSDEQIIEKIENDYLIEVLSEEIQEICKA